MEKKSWRLLEEGPGKDIYENLAIEEALAKVNAERHNKVNTLRFWQSKPAVVLGRFQCLHREINMEYCRTHRVAIARRFTGGGTVYHDGGNLNFSICADQREPYVARTLPELYWNFVGTIARGLQKIGIPARFDPERSCLRINGKKITGTAGWVKRGVAFIHGTLLLESDLDNLRRCLDVPPGQPRYARIDGRVRCLGSKRDVVTCVAHEIGHHPTVDEIKRAIVSSIGAFTGVPIEEGTMDATEKGVAESLYQSRYSRPEWNLGVPRD